MLVGLSVHSCAPQSSTERKTGELKVAARHERIVDIQLRPGQSARWSFRVAKLDIGFSVDVKAASGRGASRRIAGPLKLQATRMVRTEDGYPQAVPAMPTCGEYAVPTKTKSPRAVAGEAVGETVSFRWDNNYSRMTSKKVKYSIDIFTPLDLVSDNAAVATVGVAAGN